MKTAVVGAGIIGASCAFELASCGHDVTVFEQFDIDHDRGSSFGDSRIIRLFYDDPYYTALMPHAFALWRRIEDVSRQTLYEKLGGLYFGPAQHPSLASAMRGLASVGARPELLDAAGLRTRYPAFAFEDGEAGVVDETGGSLRASRCVRATIDAAVAAGASVRTHATVERVESMPAGRGVNLIVGGERLAFDRAAICAGPWTSGVLAGMRLPIRVTRQQYIHIRPTRHQANFEAGVMPIWIDAGAAWYGFPHHGDVDGVKIASHVFGDEVDPDRVNHALDDAVVARTRAYAEKRLPDLARGEVVYQKTCLYTVSADEDFIVDLVAGVRGCVFVSGCSGHAFKFGPLLGAVAADLVLDRAPRVDIERFRLTRFFAV